MADNAKWYVIHTYSGYENAGTVLMCSLVIGACIWIFDGVLGAALDMLLSVLG